MRSKTYANDLFAEEFFRLVCQNENEFHGFVL